MTMTIIAHQEVGPGVAGNITFSNIPQTFTDLFLYVSGRADDNLGVAWNNAFLRPNNATTNLTARGILGIGSSPSVGNESNWTFWVCSSQATANTFGNTSFYIPNYTSANNKLVTYETTQESNTSQTIVAVMSGVWAQTSAITSLVIQTNDMSWAAGSSATLYGITKGSSGGIVVS